MKIHELTLPIDPVTNVRMQSAEFQVKFQQYVTARNAHRATVNTPAPLPEHEVFRVAYDRGEGIEIEAADPFEAHRREGVRDVVAEFDQLIAELTAKGTITPRGRP